MAGGVQSGFGPPPPPAPRSGNSSCLSWGLGGCGLVVILVSILGAVMFNRFAKDKGAQQFFNSMQSAQSCVGNLNMLRAALQNYQADHKGKYPATLSTLIPKYLPNSSALTCGTANTMTLEYTPPRLNAPSDSPVVSFRSAEAVLFGKSRQVTIYRMLKDGRIVLDNIQRSELQTQKDRQSGGRSD